MGYRGYTEFLCDNGHYTVDRSYHGDKWKEECDFCLSKWTYFHKVDITNGYDGEDPACCDAPKTQIGFDDDWRRDHYNNRYAKKVFKFKPGQHWSEMNKDK